MNGSRRSIPDLVIGIVLCIDDAVPRLEFFAGISSSFFTVDLPKFLVQSVNRRRLIRLPLFVLFPVPRTQNNV